MRRALIVLALVACGKAAPEHPNVLLVTIDTLRPDAVGEGTPAIRDFLAQATRFSATRTVAPLTLPAHTSMFTGLLPAAHGIHDNVTEPLPPREARGFPLLAEQFRDAGYATAGFVARAVLAAPTGVGSGFDLYDCPLQDGEWEEEGGYIPGEERIRAPLAWIEGAQKGKPWFVWVHLFDPHAPYHAFPGDARRAPTRESDPIQVRYAGEARRADAAIEKLLAAVPPDTVVVLASDHGESLGEHGEPTHGPLCYGSTIRSFLAVRADGFKAGADDRGLRSVADIAPTLRRLCHLPQVEGEGKDLSGPPHDTLVSESLFMWFMHGWGQVLRATDGRHSLVESGGELEFFDLEKDPGETSPLPLTDPSYEKLDRAMERFRSRKWGGLGGVLLASVSPYGELRRQTTGYLSRHENGKLLNPRDYLRDHDALDRVPALVRACAQRKDPGPLTDALRTLDAIEKRTPRSPRVDHSRAKIQGAIADITGVPARYADAAWSELGAIEKGYVQKETIAPCIAYAVASNNADALKTLVRLLERSGRKLDTETAKSLAEARKLLHVEADATLAAPDR